MIDSILSVVFWAAVLGMVFLAFLWPIVISPDPGSGVLRVMCLIAFGAYLSALLGRLALRIYSDRRRV